MQRQLAGASDLVLPSSLHDPFGGGEGAGRRNDEEGRPAGAGARVAVAARGGGQTPLVRPPIGSYSVPSLRVVVGWVLWFPPMRPGQQVKGDLGRVGRDPTSRPGNLVLPLG